MAKRYYDVTCKVDVMEDGVLATETIETTKVTYGGDRSYTKTVTTHQYYGDEKFPYLGSHESFRRVWNKACETMTYRSFKEIYF